MPVSRSVNRRLPIHLAVLLLLAAVPAAARPKSILDDEQFRLEAQRGLGLLYDMDFAAASAVFAGIAQHYPDHPAGPFLQALGPWWQIQIDPSDESRDDAFLDSMETVIDRCDKRLKKNREDLDALFFRAGAHALRGRLHSDREHWLRAARDGQKALRYLQEVRKRDPENPDLLLGIGAFDYLADVVPQKHPILKPFAALFPRGNRQRGLWELAQAVEKGQFVSTEAAFTLLQIHFIFEEDYATSLHYVRWLRERHPENSLFHIFEGRAFARLGMWGEARRILGEVADRQAAGRPGYQKDIAELALFMLGRDGVRRGEYREALDVFDRLERLPKIGKRESVYRSYGRLWRGMALDAMGQREEALRYYKQVKGAKIPDSARDMARTYIKAPYQGEG